MHRFRCVLRLTFKQPWARLLISVNLLLLLLFPSLNEVLLCVRAGLAVLHVPHYRIRRSGEMLGHPMHTHIQAVISKSKNVSIRDTLVSTLFIALAACFPLCLDQVSS